MDPNMTEYFSLIVALLTENCPQLTQNSANQSSRSNSEAEVGLSLRVAFQQNYTHRPAKLAYSNYQSRLRRDLHNSLVAISPF